MSPRMAIAMEIMIGTYTGNRTSPPRLGWGWWKLGISPKMIRSTSGTATPKIRPAGSLQASLTSLRMILPNAARGAVFGSALDSAFGSGNVYVLMMSGFLPRAGAGR